MIRTCVKFWLIMSILRNRHGIWLKVWGSLTLGECICFSPADKSSSCWFLSNYESGWNKIHSSKSSLMITLMLLTHKHPLRGQLCRWRFPRFCSQAGRRSHLCGGDRSEQHCTDPQAGSNPGGDGQESGPGGRQQAQVERQAWVMRPTKPRQQKLESTRNPRMPLIRC